MFSTWLSTAEGITAPVRTSSTSRGMYLRWLQLPMLMVRFLFIAWPIGNASMVGG